MKRNVKKGFTIKELVLIIAICAIASAIIIPIGVNIVLSVEDANDGAIVVTKELNAAISEAEPNTLEEALNITKAAGFRVDRLNTRRAKVLFVFDTASKQFMLVERDTYNVIYNDREYEADKAKESWCFPVSDLRHALNLTDAGYNVMHIVSSVSELDYVFTYAPKKEKVVVYLDEDINLGNDAALKFNKTNATVTIDLLDQTLSTMTDSDKVPFVINNGQLTIKNGTVLARGDGSSVGAGIRADEDSVLNIIGTKIEISSPNGYVDYAGADGMLSDVNVNSSYIGVGAFDGSQVIIENSHIAGESAAVYSGTYGDEALAYNVANVFIKSGTYTASETKGVNEATVSACGGNVVISGGTFRNITTDGHNKLFAVDGTEGGCITITDGVFVVDGVAKNFTQMTEEDWNAVVTGTVTFEMNGNAITKVIIK